MLSIGAVGRSGRSRTLAFLVKCVLFGMLWPLEALSAAEGNCETVRYCGSAQSDPDGDGWGWESKESCIVRGSAPDPNRGKNCGSAATPSQSQLNPNFFYFFNGEILGGRGFTIGDAKDWNVPVVDLTGKTVTGKLTVKPDEYHGKGGALNAVWSAKKSRGQLALYGPPLNIAAVKDKAALVVDLKLNRKPSSTVTFSLDCQWPCRGDFEAAHILRKMPSKQWVTLPIPLNCFKGETFDLSKINGIFLLGTEGKMDISLANIRLEKLPEGSSGCAD